METEIDAAVRTCPALLISAAASGQGKTTVTAALARHHRNHGRRVRVFKTGPDFLDPMILQQASGNPVYQLDLWMGGEDHCRNLLHAAACEADLILIEGVMGLFDGDLSSADLAMLLGIPVLAVIDGSAMAQTFSALAHGLATYRPGLPFAGVFANRVAGERHYQMLVEGLPQALPVFGWLARDAEIALPERHLGLVQAAEIKNIEARIERAAAATGLSNSQLPTGVGFAPAARQPIAKQLTGVTIAVARDAAFAFLYRSNLELLEALGAELVFFSPLDDTTLPDADALYLPGGYPELHLEELAAGESMQTAMRNFYAAGRPILAECGGMMYLLESITDAVGHSAAMTGLLPGSAVMQQQLANIGMHAIDLPEGTLRGHTFHYSRMNSPLQPVAFSKAARHHGSAEPVYRHGGITASYVHAYFPSSPAAVARLFRP